MATPSTREARRLAVVITGGDAPAPTSLDGIPDDRVVVAADSGVTHAHHLGVHVDVVVGDLDSVPDAELALAVERGAEVERHPTAKDATDLELALDAAIARGATDAIVVGGYGGRLDHFLGNVLLLAAPRFASLEVEARMGTASIRVVRRDAELPGAPGDPVSLLPVNGPAHGVRTRNLRFPLVGETLAPGTTRGVSNEIVATPAGVALDEGTLLAVLPSARKDR